MFILEPDTSSLTMGVTVADAVIVYREGSVADLRIERWPPLAST
jgi:hypothetical protein